MGDKSVYSSSGRLSSCRIFCFFAEKTVCFGGIVFSLDMYEWMESLTVCMWKDKCGGCREGIWVILLSIEIRSSDAFGSLKYAVKTKVQN